MNVRQLNTSREVRLWIVQVVIPVCAITLLANKKTKEMLEQRLENVKRRCETTFRDLTSY